MKKLSILICHIQDRQAQLDKLMACLEKQKTDDVEILVETDAGKDNGGLQIGAKRNKLLYNARGKYISYVDDDDRISDGTEHPAYIPSVLTAIESGPVFDAVFDTPDAKIAKLVPHQGPRPEPDCVGITGQLRFANDPYLFFYHSMKHSIDWWDDKATAPPGKAQYYRTPNHLNPIKREIAMACRFESTSSWSEDHSYGRLVHKLIKTETTIEHPIYYYVKP